MSTIEKLEIEKVFEIATQFVEAPALFEKYPDGSEFYIGRPLSAFEPVHKEIIDGGLQVRVRIGKSNIHEDF